MEQHRSSPEGTEAGPSRGPLALDVGTVLLLPALTVYLGLNAGGYFAAPTGWAGATMAAVLAVRMVVSGPRAIAAWPLALAGGGLALFAIWTLLSGVWSGDHAAALIEFDRSLLYLLVLLVFGSIQAPRTALRYLPLGFALGAVFLCAVALATRTLPDLWPFAPEPGPGKLAYPVTYSNGLGILASLAILTCLHLASWEREWVAARVVAVSALPLLVATLVLTRSEGAAVMGAIGVALYVVLGRPRGLLTALFAAVPFALIGGHAAEAADLLGGRDPTTPAALDEGRELASTVGLAMLGAAAVIGALIPLERWVKRRVGRGGFPRLPRPAAAAIAGGLAIAVVGVAVTQLPEAVDALEHEFEGRRGAPETSTRGFALLDGQSRIDYWRVAVDAFEEEPITGTGAGTFTERWARDRPFFENVEEGHSVYVETLGELGLVGAALLALVLGGLAAAFVVAMRRTGRVLGAAALGAAVAWLAHAGIDWDWELPVLTVWLFAFGGCALAAWPERRPSARTETGRLTAGAVIIRALAAAACLLVAVTPVTIAISQSWLDGATSALLRDDCDEAERLASSASRLLPPRPEPYEVLGYCASRRGEHERAISMMRGAIDRDPDSWELAYGLALVRAAAGEDPRAAADRALRLNRLEFIARRAVTSFSEGPRRWRRSAETLALPLP